MLSRNDGFAPSNNAYRRSFCLVRVRSRESWPSTGDTIIVKETTKGRIIDCSFQM
jgi:hypothetical protein